MNSIYIFSQFTKIILVFCHFYIWILTAYCLASMAISFGLVDIRNNRFIINCFNVLAKLVEPVLIRIRSILPDIGMLDLSPIVLFILLEYLIPYILREIFRLVISSQGF